MKSVIGLIPCAGTASRLFNLPKFMLPMKDKNISLLSNWINILEKLECNKIIIGVSPTTEIFVSHLIKTQFSESKTNIIIKLVGNTETMNETIDFLKKHSFSAHSNKIDVATAANGTKEIIQNHH